jgi:CheY-like chemotaxis protein
VTEFSVLAKQKQLKLMYVKTSIWLKTDRRLLSRVIQNLLSNAIKYTASGRILLGVKRRGKAHCEIIVADTGSGIAKEHQQHIFTEFQRIHNDNTHPGLGLGLTIVDKISHLLNYQVSLRSAPNQGSAFGITLPISVKPEISTSTRIAQTSDDTPLFLSNKYILVLENDTSVATALLTLLRGWGATVESAASKKDVLGVLSETSLPPDLIIADYHLNNGDNGIDVALLVHTKLDHNIATVLSSADRSEDIQALAYEHDMQYLPKPIKQAALKRLLQKLLKSRP